MSNIFFNIIGLLTNPSYRFEKLRMTSKYRSLPDRVYLEKAYKAYFHKKLDLNQPKTFNEKLQWLKLYDRRPEYTIMADKYLVRKYIAKTIGEEYLIPLLGVWDTPEQIDFNVLPDQFVLKCNHNSGKGMCICRSKNSLDFEEVKMRLRKGLKQEYYSEGREWPYRNIPRKIICERYLQDDELKDLPDYKVHNFNGIPRVILVCKNRFNNGGLTENFYTPDWKLLPVQRPCHPNAVTDIPEPSQLQEILRLSKILSKDIPFVRTDFYVVNQHVYFGEITFYPGSGFLPFEPEKWDRFWGDWITLPENN